MEKIESTRTQMIQYQESDFQGEIKLATLFSLMSDLATENAIARGLWKQEYQDQYGWVLSKQTVKLKRPIKVAEAMTLTTRIKDGSRVQFSRTYQIQSDDEIIGGAYSLWTLIDLKKRTIIKPTSIGIDIPKDEPYQCFVDHFSKIDKSITVHHVQRRQVVYSDLDINQHMNNYRYIEWALDVIDLDLYRQYFIEEISVHYQKEIRANALVDIYLGQDGQRLRIYFQCDDKICFEMALTLQQRDQDV